MCREEAGGVGVGGFRPYLRPERGLVPDPGNGKVTIAEDNCPSGGGDR